MPGDTAATAKALPRAGTTELLLRRYDARLGSSRVRVVVHATAPGGHEAAAATFRVRAITRRPPPVPKLLGLRVRRRGPAIVVSWHTAIPARRVFYYVDAPRARRAAVPGRRVGRRLWQGQDAVEGAPAPAPPGAHPLGRDHRREPRRRARARAGPRVSAARWPRA
jgi:hypothetical protein